MVRSAEWLAALAGAVLVASLFFSWYTLTPGGDGESAWQALSVIDVVCAVCGLLVLSMPVVFSFVRLIPVATALASLTAAFAPVCFLCVLFRTLVAPSAPVPGTTLTVAFGAYLGLVAAAACSIAAWASVRDDRYVAIGETESLPMRPIPVAEVMAARERSRQKDGQ